MNDHGEKTATRLFDDWPDKYDNWFTSPTGQLVKAFESELLLDMLKPRSGEHILDVGCGTGIFTLDVLASGASVIGLDISHPMLIRAAQKTTQYSFAGVAGDMCFLPFPDESFDKTYSITSLEFVNNGRKAAAELNRVTRKNGTVVLATLNSLSPWAIRRNRAAAKGHSLFKNIIFRSPKELERLSPEKPEIKTAIHFLKEDDPEKIPAIEQAGCLSEKDTGAFIAAVWKKEDRGANID